ncbi:MAG: hypothetical protein COV30_00140 [Candidatus Yanofskybacteria bacterium CG10_big_fil_rev_8_21_14_0_10_37_15]|uniref:Uncharacterized protein n=1 Tax=Candidatus Yanofskybacteria bacterium CG10_big_fil_rev_8_21_14_0_10_37_15 TaxID=1975097 RepID=A0A2H0R6K0_9BACT|nr:MAG: hypothetical protein COV30_00140 [Candidatus Yanofskybacteria bacterium CG10_big_fil_rev_8_21_14_0_10_37_15]
MLIKKIKLFLTPLVILSGFFGFVFYSNAATVNHFDINPKTISKIIPGEPVPSLQYEFVITSSEDEIQNECGGFFSAGKNLYWEIARSAGSGPGPAARGSIVASDFLLNNGSIPKTGSFNSGITANTTSINYQLLIGCGAPDEFGPTGITKRLAASAPITVNITGQQTGTVAISNFDANPKNVQPGSTNDFNFSFDITAKQSDVENTCSDKKIVWRMYRFPADGGDVFENPIKSGAITSTEFGSGKTIPQNFSQSIVALNKDFIFKVRLSCNVSFGSDTLATSNAVLIQSGGAGPNCGNPGQPECEKPKVEDRTIFFSIPNPLKGGADDLSGLIKIIAQWIFNLAIPIAVIMIIYSGVLFLTAQGNSQQVTKAKDVLKWAVVGLAIILIGSGFVTLIKSILELGAPKP